MHRGIKNQISPDFPLYHSHLIPIYRSPEERKYEFGKKTNSHNVYTNEHPDFFRLDGMRESGYRNPYLDEVLKVDRSEQLKKMAKNAHQINLIDFMKSSRKYSQDPKMLKFIRSEFDIQMQKKRAQISEDRKNKKIMDKDNYAHKYLITENDDKNLAKIIRKLDGYTPRINYKMKSTFDTYGENAMQIGLYKTNRDNFGKVNKICCSFDPMKSSYITNSNDYKISEAQERDKEKELTHERKTVSSFDLINYKNKKMQPPIKPNPKWSPFYENFFVTLMKNRTGFGQKGGLFTEFTNKNIGVINVNKRELREQMAKLRKIKLNNIREKFAEKNGISFDRNIGENSLVSSESCRFNTLNNMENRKLKI